MAAPHNCSSLSPPSLSDYAKEHERELKKRIVDKRRLFWNDGRAQEDCEHWVKGDNEYAYSDEWQRGLVPPSLVGPEKYHKSDTFFSDFKEHNPKLVLSESNESYIIGNRASYDKRQYIEKWAGSDRTPAAGMSYLHLLIIPKKRVYNVVQLTDTKLIQEMIHHFKTFWKDPGSVGKVNERIELAVKEREQEVLSYLEKHDRQKIEEFREFMVEVWKSRENLAKKLQDEHLSLGEQGIVFRFHAGKDASIPQLHMHVLAAAAEYREFSTSAHDYKAIPAKMVMEVIESENVVLRIFYMLLNILRYTHLIKGGNEIYDGSEYFFPC